MMSVGNCVEYWYESIDTKKAQNLTDHWRTTDQRHPAVLVRQRTVSID
jgi:hypothetical protein